jgi:hypothetical protein
MREFRKHGEAWEDRFKDGDCAFFFSSRHGAIADNDALCSRGSPPRNRMIAIPLCLAASLARQAPQAEPDRLAAEAVSRSDGSIGDNHISADR